MYIPSAQNVLTAGLGFMGAMTGKKVISGEILDYAVEKCVDADKNQRCTAPFAVVEGTCYNIKWSTDGTLSHTTVEVRDSTSFEIVYYRDTNGEWTPKKNELVYLDFKPKIAGQGNKTVEYEVTKCD